MLLCTLKSVRNMQAKSRNLKQSLLLTHQDPADNGILYCQLFVELSCETMFIKLLFVSSRLQSLLDSFYRPPKCKFSRAWNSAIWWKNAHQNNEGLFSSVVMRPNVKVYGCWKEHCAVWLTNDKCGVVGILNGWMRIKSVMCHYVEVTHFLFVEYRSFERQKSRKPTWIGPQGTITM